MDKQKAVRKEKEGAFVDLLNQEIKELQDSQKQIKELAEDIHAGMQPLYGDWKEYSQTDLGLAYKLYGKGYRKIHENAVVLTREDLADMKFTQEHCDLYLENKWLKECIPLARKKTVEKFAERVKMAFYQEFDELIPSIMADKIDEICKEITEGK